MANILTDCLSFAASPVVTRIWDEDDIHSCRSSAKDEP